MDHKAHRLLPLDVALVEPVCDHAAVCQKVRDVPALDCSESDCEGDLQLRVKPQAIHRPQPRQIWLQCAQNTQSE